MANRWAEYTRAFLATFAALLCSAAAFVAIMNPYGNLPNTILKSHVIMDSDQRFQYPAIIRSGRYDSAVVGTSSARLFNPMILGRELGGDFANLAVNAARAWEQFQIAKLFFKHTPKPRTLIVGLDAVWCLEQADVERTRGQDFPHWLYDDIPWNDLLYMLNGKALEVSFRKLGFYMGIGTPALPSDGYASFMPPETLYDAPKARIKIWGGERRSVAPLAAAEPISDAERAAWRFPAIVWLEELADMKPAETRLVFVFVPLHVAALPIPGSKDQQREAACQQRILDIAKRVGAPVVDFRFASAITRRDENYWDALHIRVPLADQVTSEIAAAVLLPAGSRSEIWRRLDR